MGKLYKLNGNMAEISISKELYPLITIKKAIANYLDNVYIKLEDVNNNVLLKIQLKNENDNLEKIVGEFYNELADALAKRELGISIKKTYEKYLAEHEE